MKVINIKHFLLCLFWGIGYLFANAQGLTVHMKDGTRINVPYEQLDSISTYINDEEPITIIGTWRCNTDDGYKTLTFNMNGTGVDYEYWEYDNDFSSENFTWKTNGDVLTLTYIDEGNSVITCTYVASSEILIINWGAEYETYVKIAGENEDPNSDPNYPIRGPIARSFKGSGTKSDPYIISKASELRKLADDVTDKGKAYVGAYFSLTSDITINKNVLDADGELSGYGDALEQWKPIGWSISTKEQFRGVFDGNGHTISGLYIDEDENHCGLFAGGTIKNLIIRDSYITGPAYMSAIGGESVSCCISYATVESKSNFASGITSMNNAVVYGCTNYGKIKGGNAAGIAGRGGCVNRCVNYGRVEATSSEAVGIQGWCTQKDTVMNCVNFGHLKSSNRVAGIKGSVASVGRVYNNVNFGILEGKYGGGIYIGGRGLTSYKCYIENNVNVGRNDGGAEIYGLYYSSQLSVYIKNNFYLESSYLSMYGENKNGYRGENNRGMTEEEMKSQTFLDELNRNARALGSEYSRWKFGKDGFPILEWIEE